MSFPILDIVPEDSNEFYDFTTDGQLIYRIGTIGDGSCLLHAFLLAFNEDYQRDTSQNRKKKVTQLRFEIANDPSFQNYFASNPNFVDFEGLQESIRLLCNPPAFLTQDVAEYLGSMFGFNIWFYDINNKRWYGQDRLDDPNQPGIVIGSLNRNHFELMGVQTGVTDTGQIIQTVFDRRPLFPTQP